MFEEKEAPKRNSTLSFAAISAAGLSLLCIAIGQGASQFAELTSSPPALTAVASNAKTPKFNAIDYGTTGSIKGQSVVISPCER